MNFVQGAMHDVWSSWWCETLRSSRSESRTNLHFWVFYLLPFASDVLMPNLKILYFYITSPSPCSSLVARNLATRALDHVIAREHSKVSTNSKEWPFFFPARWDPYARECWQCFSLLVVTWLEVNESRDQEWTENACQSFSTSTCLYWS